jgi:hypothetical protein
MAIFNETQTEFNQQIINDYRIAHPSNQEFTMYDVAAWAIFNNRWSATNESAIKSCARELAQAARVEYEEDQQGRRIRTKHVRRETVHIDGQAKQMYIWEDIHNASPYHMQISLQQRRQAIVSDCAQLMRDTDSYNDNNTQGAHIQMSFDFTEDMLELNAPEEYPEAANEEDGD